MQLNTGATSVPFCTSQVIWSVARPGQNPGRSSLGDGIHGPVNDGGRERGTGVSLPSVLSCLRVYF